MKKKVIATMLVSSMLLLPFPVFADDEDNYLHTLRFDKIKTEMESRSPVISAMWEKVSDGADKIDDGLDKIKPYRDGLVSTVSSIIFAYTDGQKTYNKGMTILDLTPPTPLSEDASTEEMINYLNAQSAYLTISSLLSQILTLDSQVESLEKSNDDLWKSYIQAEQGKNQTIRGAQQLFLGYFTAEQGRDELKRNIDLLEDQIKVNQLQESLGMVTSVSTLEAEAKLKELRHTLDTLNKSIENMKGSINIMLGQDYDTELTLVEPSEVTRSMIRDLDYDEDLEDALIQSYDVSLAEDSDDIQQAKKDFTFSFYKVHQSLLDKQKALQLAEEKLTLEQMKYDYNYLKHSLGLMSRLEFDGLRSVYTSQVDAVETAQRELLQAYTDYEWMKKGLTVSVGGSGASSASSGAGGMSSSSGAGAMGGSY